MPRQISNANRADKTTVKQISSIVGFTTVASLFGLTAQGTNISACHPVGKVICAIAGFSVWIGGNIMILSATKIKGAISEAKKRLKIGLFFSTMASFTISLFGAGFTYVKKYHDEYKGEYDDGGGVRRQLGGKHNYADDDLVYDYLNVTVCKEKLNLSDNPNILLAFFLAFLSVSIIISAISYALLDNSDLDNSGGNYRSGGTIDLSEEDDRESIRQSFSVPSGGTLGAHLLGHLNQEHSSDEESREEPDQAV